MASEFAAFNQAGGRFRPFGTLAEIALAWLMAHGRDIVPIPGAKSRHHFQENIKAIDLHLTDDDIDHLNAIMPLGAAAGTRLPEAQLARVNI